MTERIQLEFEVPGPDAPGYLKRQRDALAFSLSLSDNPTPDDIDAMVKFLSQFVTKPNRQEEREAALWDASEDEFFALINAIIGESEADPTTEE